VRVKCINSEQNLERRSTGSDPSDVTSTSQSHGVYQHCYTASLVPVRRGEQISIRCLYGMKTIVMQPEFTFWGMVKFG